MLKEALFHVTHFYSTGTVDRKEVEGSSCAVIDNNASDEKRGLGAASQQQHQQQVGVQGGEETNGSHVLAERRRREKLNDRFMTLRALVPFVTKVRSYLCPNANAYCWQTSVHRFYLWPPLHKSSSWELEVKGTFSLVERSLLPMLVHSKANLHLKLATWDLELLLDLQNLGGTLMYPMWNNYDKLLLKPLSYLCEVA